MTRYEFRSGQDGRMRYGQLTDLLGDPLPAAPGRSLPGVTGLIVSKAEILRKDTRSVEHGIQRCLDDLRRDTELERLASSALDGKKREARALMDALAKVHLLSFSIDGYNDDPRALYEIPEVRVWGRAWFERQPIAPLVVSDGNNNMVIMMLVGGIRRGETHHIDARSSLVTGLLESVRGAFGPVLLPRGVPLALECFLHLRYQRLEQGLKILARRQGRGWRFWRR